MSLANLVFKVKVNHPIKWITRSRKEDAHEVIFLLQSRRK